MGNHDPLADPSTDDVSKAYGHDATLTLGKDISLTLGTDALIVLDESYQKRDRDDCCGFLRQAGKKATRAIPFYNVLWVEVSERALSIQYAKPTSKTVVVADTVQYAIDEVTRPPVTIWAGRLLERAYGPSQKVKRLKVLVNPFSGTGGAQKWYAREIEPLFRAAQCAIDVEQTQFQGHAVDIAKELDIDAYDVIVSCSGDGLPHEVFNGLGQRQDAKKALAQVALAQLPCGSGNAMSWNLYGTDSPSLAALGVIKGLRTPLDLVSITQDHRRTLSFLSQSVGVVAETDLGTENLRWMGGARFTFGFLVRLLGKTVYPCDIAIQVEVPDKVAIRGKFRQELGNLTPAEERRDDPSTSSTADMDQEGLPPLRYGTVTDDLPSGWAMVPYDKLGNFYAGNMAYMAADANFFPAALPNDGCLDLVCIDGDISRLAAIQALTAVGKGTFFDMDQVSYRKILGYRIIPRGRDSGYISIDGERIPFEPFQAEVHRGLGTVLSKSGHLYEAEGVEPKA
ncbi:MAG: sphinganine kinase lcb4 [Thelocarpon superellum]|nr:MAG: sphinganine kinase lcb4 [Thelocarpon superellum]